MWNAPILRRYCRLSVTEVAVTYPLTRLDDLIDILGNDYVFNRVDEKCRYWNILVAEANKDKNFFTTQHGTYISRNFSSSPLRSFLSWLYIAQTKSQSGWVHHSSNPYWIGMARVKRKNLVRRMRYCANEYHLVRSKRDAKKRAVFKTAFWNSNSSALGSSHLCVSLCCPMTCM